MKKLVWGLALTVLVLTLGFFAVGGKQGLTLLYVKHVLHTEAAPTQAVNWQQAPAAKASNGKRPPNILLIVADDLGYNDISLNGGGVAADAVPTPNINSIAKNGIDFTGGYAGNATCSPSRAAMLTGRYPTRFGFEFTSVPVTFSKVIAAAKSKGLNPVIYHADREAGMPAYESQGVPATEISMAKLLKQEKDANPTLKSICQIADALGIPPAFLLLRDRDWKVLAESVMAYELARTDNRFNAFCDRLASAKVDMSQLPAIVIAELFLQQLDQIINRRDM